MLGLYQPMLTKFLGLTDKIAREFRKQGSAVFRNPSASKSLVLPRFRMSVRGLSRGQVTWLPYQEGQRQFHSGLCIPLSVIYIVRHVQRSSVCTHRHVGSVLGYLGVRLNCECWQDGRERLRLALLCLEATREFNRRHTDV
jgi:hypothetical protein